MNALHKLRVRIALLVCVVILSVLGPWLAPSANEAVYSSPAYSAPGPGHLLGTDHLGRSIAPRLLSGLRLSLAISGVVVGICLLVGMLIGALSGYLGGWFDLLFQRIIDILLAFPGLLLAIALAAFLGAGAPQLVIALSATGWISFARLARGQALALRDKEFVIAAECLGYSTPRILVRHLIPNLAAPMVVQATFSLAAVIIGESSLSFLGLGIPDAPSLGALIRDGAREMQISPYMAIWPGLAILGAVLVFNSVGDALRDWWDVKDRTAA